MKTGKIQQPLHFSQLHQKSQGGERLFHITSAKPMVANCRSKLTSFFIEVLQLGSWNLNKWPGTNTVFLFVLYVIFLSSTVLLFWNKNIPGINCIDRKAQVYDFHLLWETKPTSAFKNMWIYFMVECSPLHVLVTYSGHLQGCHNRWPKHARGYANYNTINSLIWFCFSQWIISAWSWIIKTEFHLLWACFSFCWSLLASL